MFVMRTQVRSAIGIAIFAALSASAPLEAARAGSTPTVLQRWTLGGDGGWDYLTLERSGIRLFISHSNRVDVVETGAGKLLGTIPNTNGVHGIALAEDLKRGYTSNGKADSVTEFDLDTLKVIKEAPIPGHNPDAILYEPIGKHVFTFNGRSKDVTILDAQTLAVVGRLPVPDKPEFAVDDGAGRIFVNIESEPGQMVVIDSSALKIKAIWPLPGCASPSGLAMDRIHHRLFSVCDDKVMAVTDSETGKQVTKIKIGDGPDAANFDSKRGLVFSSNGDGTLSVIRQVSADRYTLAASVPTMMGARTMAFDPANGRVYLVSAEFGPAPVATAATPRPRPVPKSGTFTVLVVGTR
jgi:DNA-binding beta-propeller fold protein YncE